MTRVTNKNPDPSPSEQSMYIQSCEAQFIQLIAKRLGLIIHSQGNELHNIIRTACHKFQCNPEDYLQMLTTCPDNSPMLEHLIAEVTIGETYFFRDKGQTQFLKQSLLSKIVKNKREQNNLSLRIWSAGCSSGEELYTIAIILNELLPDIDCWKLHLLGTDIAINRLEKAKQGYYNKWSMRNTSNYHKQLYFKEEDNQFILCPKIRDRVDFSYLNLKDNTYPSIINGTNSQDLIICRNVLIYFDEESIVQLMKKISLSLAEGGILLLGASDPVILQGTNLVRHPHESMTFSRQDDKHEIMKKNSKTPSKITIQNNLPSTKQGEDSFKKKQDHAKNYPSGETNPVLLLNSKAKDAANIGQLDQALKYCEQSLALDSTHKDTYYLFALILIELNKLQEAEAAFRKTLYLDHTFVEGHFQLSLLLFKKKRYKEGLKCLQNALAIVNTKESSQIVPGSQGLSYGHFAEIIKTEIRLNNEK